MQPQALPRAVRAALRDVLSTPGLRGGVLSTAVEAAGKALGVEPFRACLLLLAAGQRSESEARGVFEAIESHRDALEARLLRDPGFSVAAADYLHAAGSGGWTRGHGRPRARSGHIDRDQPFDDILETEIRRHQRTGRPLAIVLMSPPTPPGEIGWRDAACAVADAARDVDHIARLLPEGLCAVLPCTSGTEAIQAAARFRAVAARVTAHGWHCGVAAVPGVPAAAAAIAAAARAALHEARREDIAVRCAGSERRRHGRGLPSASVSARIGAGRRVAEASIEDLSLGGVLVRTPRPLVPGLRVDLEIGDGPPRARRFAVAARVVRSEAPPPGSTGAWRAALRFEAGAAGLPMLAEILATRRMPGAGS